MNSNDKNLFRISEKVIESNGEWRIRTNSELEQLMKNEDIVKFIKSRGLAWKGHAVRMDGNRIQRRIMEWKTVGRRKRGRPRERWMDDIEKDIQVMNFLYLMSPTSFSGLPRA